MSSTGLVLLSSTKGWFVLSNERRAPVQGDFTIKRGEPGHADGSIEWLEHEEVWRAYAQKYGTRQSAERIAERGGFGFREIVSLTGGAPKTWRPVDAGF